MARRPLSAMADRDDGPNGEQAIVFQIIRDIHEAVQDIDVTLRGERGENGLVSRVGHLERTCTELRKTLDDVHVRLTLKVYPTEEVQQAKWKALAIWGGVALAFLGAAVDVIRLIIERLP